MTIQQLASFLEVARVSSFSLAADNLYLSQPTLSRQIASLEDELGVQLFIRANNTVRLSEIGAALHPKLVEMVDGFSRDNEELFNLIGSFSNRLTIGIMAEQQLDERVCGVLRRFRDEIPSLDLQIQILEYPDAPPALINGSVDLLFCFDHTVPSMGSLRSLMLTEETLCLAVPVSHRYAGMRELKHEEIGTYFGDLPLWLMDAQAFEAPLRPFLRRNLEEQKTDGAGFLMSMSSLCTMVSAGLAMTYANESSRLALDPEVVLIPLKGREGYETIRKGVFWRAANEKTTLRRFLELLRAEFASG